VRTLLLLALLSAWLARPATPQWRPEHKVLAATAVTMLLLDHFTTVDGIKRGYRESNPLLGPHPSLGRLNTFTALEIMAELGIGALLPDRARTIWFAVLTGMEFGYVWHNFAVGLHVKFRL